MWGLANLRTGKVARIITNEEECVVGRSYGGITILGDASISRRHAVLKLIHSMDNLEKLDCPSTLTIKDAGSKYGTFVNGERLNKDSTKSLSANDEIKFGQIGSLYRVFCQHIVISTSCIVESELVELKKIIFKLGGHVVHEWQASCTHLVMPFVKVTIKALCCLVSLKPLVTQQFFHALLTSVTTNVPEKAFPREKDYIPPVQENLIDQQIASFNIVPDRKTLFKNRTFIFLDRDQFQKLRLPIMISEGTAVLEEGKDSPNFSSSSFVEPGKCVVQPTCDNSKAHRLSITVFEHIKNIFKRNKKRFIPEHEIVLAVVYCSTEKYCNPDFNKSTPMLASKDKAISQSFSQRQMCTQDSKEMDHEMILCENTVSSNSDASCDGQMSIQKSIEESQADVRQQSVSDNSSDCISIENESSKKVIAEINLSSDNEEQEIPDVVVISGKNGIGRKVGFGKRKVPCFTEHVPSKKAKAMDCSKNPSVYNSSFSESAVKDLPTEQQANCKDVAELVAKAVNASKNGINSTQKANESTFLKSFDENLPSNLVKVNFRELVKRTMNRDITTENRNVNRNVKNFKQFKKVLHVGARSLPKIIGGNDLVSHQDVLLSSNRRMNEWIEPHPEEIRDSPAERGEFDWVS